jgi:hypothetical protein
MLLTTTSRLTISPFLHHTGPSTPQRNNNAKQLAAFKPTPQSVSFALATSVTFVESGHLVKEVEARGLFERLKAAVKAAFHPASHVQIRNAVTSQPPPAALGIPKTEPLTPAYLLAREQLRKAILERPLYALHLCPGVIIKAYNRQEHAGHGQQGVGLADNAVN